MTGRLFATFFAGGVTLLLAGGGGGGAAAVTTTAAPTSTATLLPMPTSTTSVPTYRRYVHPAAKAMAGIDWARMTATPLGKKLVAQIDAMGLKAKAKTEGMDFIADIEKLVLSSPGEVGATEGSAPRLSEDAPFVVAMQGHFKIEPLRKSLMARKATRVVHQNAEVWMPAKGDTALAIVNAQLMLIGDRKSLRATLDAEAEQDGPNENPVVRRAGELAGQYDLWMVSDASIDGLGGQQAKMLEGLDQFEMGVSLRAGLKADVSLHGRTPEDTSKLSVMLAGAKALAGMSLGQGKTKDADLAAMLDKLEIGTAEGRVMLSVSYSQPELDRGIARMMAANSKPTAAPEKPSKATAVETAAIVPLPPPPPARPMVVRIYNAEGGTREFKLNP